jgi:hypothetical protein
MAMGLKTYAITAEPGKPPTFRILGSDGLPGPPVPAEAVPSWVLEHAAWVSALADGLPMPPGAAPPAVFELTQPQGGFAALVPMPDD